MRQFTADGQNNYSFQVLLATIFLINTITIGVAALSVGRFLARVRF